MIQQCGFENGLLTIYYFLYLCHMLYQAKEDTICKYSGLKIDQVCYNSGSRVTKALTVGVAAGKEK